MKQKMKLILILPAVVLLAAGCGLGDTAGKKVGESIVENAIESQTGGKADISSEDRNVSIKTKEGETRYSSGGEVKLPENFPKEMIIADDAKIIISNSSEGGSSVAYTSETDPQSLFDKYKNELPGKGWKQETIMDIGSAKMAIFSKENLNVNISIGDNNSSENSGKSMVNVMLIKEEKKAPAPESE
jgi:hypothetical protein